MNTTKRRRTLRSLSVEEVSRLLKDEYPSETNLADRLVEAGIDGDMLADLDEKEMVDLLKDLRIERIDRTQFVNRMRRLSVDGVDEDRVTPRNTPQRTSIWSSDGSSTSEDEEVMMVEEKDDNDSEDDDLERLLERYTQDTILGRVLRSLRDENMQLKRMVLARSLHVPGKNATASHQNTSKNWIFRNPEDRIGEGAFAEVFRVHKETTTSSVIEYFALKRLKVVAYENINEIEALRNEVAIHSSLHHPSVVSLIDTYTAPYDDDEESSIPVLHMIMEYADHGSLHDVIHSSSQREQKNNTLTRDVVWHYVVQIFSALYYLHEHRVVHRDIKPLNIFLSGPDGRIVKLGDFGISIKLDPDVECLYDAVG